MELYQLKTFVAVANEGNLSRAAVKLFTSQPAVSAQIKALELSLGIPLFARSPKGMTLTSQGRTLFDDAQRALAAADQLRRQAKRLRGEVEGTVRLGTIVDPLALRIGAFLARLATQYPQLVTQLRQGVSGTVADAVLRGELDAGYVIGPFDEPLARDDLAPVTLVVALPPDAAQARTWTDVIALPWLDTPDFCSFHKLGRRLFDQHGSAPRRIVEADQESTLLALVGQGVGASLLREDVARDAARDGRCVVWEPGRVATTLAFVYRADRIADPMIDAVRAVTRIVWDLEPA